VNDTSRRILVVDDDDGILFLLTKALERNDYLVECASDGLEGLEKLQNSPPFAVMLVALRYGAVVRSCLHARSREESGLCLRHC